MSAAASSSSSSSSSSPSSSSKEVTKSDGEVETTSSKAEEGEKEQQQQNDDDDDDDNLRMRQALLDFRNRYEQLKHNPCFVSEIVVRGNKRTREKLIKNCFEKRVEKCGNLEEIKDELLKGREELEKYNIFKGINVTLDAG